MNPANSPGTHRKQSDQGSDSGFYWKAVVELNKSKVPFLVGGAYALERLTGIARSNIKDLDLFLRPKDCPRALKTLSAVGYRTELTFPHWLGKAFCGEQYIDIIFNSGNGIGVVDDEWFEYAIDDDLLGAPVKLCPVEESIWVKSYIMERERYDGADVNHLLLAYGDKLDWQRLLRRFGSHWRLLLSQLILFRFVYPSEQSQIPAWVVGRLLRNLQAEMKHPHVSERVCQGTLLSREQYLTDIEMWRYEDARLLPRGNLTEAERDHWTEAIDKEKK